MERRYNQEATPAVNERRLTRKSERPSHIKMMAKRTRREKLKKFKGKPELAQSRAIFFSVSEKMETEDIVIFSANNMRHRFIDPETGDYDSRMNMNSYSTMFQIMVTAGLWEIVKDEDGKPIMIKSNDKKGRNVGKEIFQYRFVDRWYE